MRHSNASSYTCTVFSKAPITDAYFKQVNEKTAVVNHAHKL